MAKDFRYIDIALPVAPRQHPAIKRLVKLISNADLFSLRNPATRHLSLYVMQNAHGLIKIGRSDNPQRRLTEIQQDARCAVALIATFPDVGHFKEWVHLQMARRRAGNRSTR